MSGDILRKLEHLQTVWHLKRAHAHACAHMQTHFSVSPELVPLHSVTVIEGHRTAVGNGIKTKLLGMLRIPRTDVFSPTEREHLPGQTGPSGWLARHMVLSPAERRSLLCPQGEDGFREMTSSREIPLGTVTADRGVCTSHSMDCRTAK